VGHRGLFQNGKAPLEPGKGSSIARLRWDDWPHHYHYDTLHFLAFEQRCHDDPRTIGDLFFTRSDEIDDLSLAEALQRLLALALNKVRGSGEFVEAAILAIIDAIMGAAIAFIKTSRNLSGNSLVVSTS
jgi:hypothetical protein